MMNRSIKVWERLLAKIGPWTRRGMLMSVVVGSFLTYGWMREDSNAPALPTQPSQVGSIGSKKKYDL